jgi:hypothetical protein
MDNLREGCRHVAERGLCSQCLNGSYGQDNGWGSHGNSNQGWGGQGNGGQWGSWNSGGNQYGFLAQTEWWDLSSDHDGNNGRWGFHCGRQPSCVLQLLMQILGGELATAFQHGGLNAFGRPYAVGFSQHGITIATCVPGNWVPKDVTDCGGGDGGGQCPAACANAGDHCVVSSTSLLPRPRPRVASLWHQHNDWQQNNWQADACP